MVVQPGEEETEDGTSQQPTASSEGEVEGQAPISLVTNDRIQGNSMKLCQGRVRLDLGKRALAPQQVQNIKAIFAVVPGTNNSST